jgi:hypothetical protein
MAVITACVIQTGTTAFDTEVTLAKAEALIAEPGRLGASIAVLPEGLFGGYPKGADFHIFLGARTPEGRERGTPTCSWLPEWSSATWHALLHRPVLRPGRVAPGQALQADAHSGALATAPP